MGQLITVFINNIFPIAIAAGIGYLLSRKGVIQPESLAHLALYLFTPCYIFVMLTNDPLPWGSMLTMLGFTAVFMVAVSALMGLFGWAMHWKKSIIAAAVLATLATNSGNYGIPLATFAFGEKAASTAAVYMVGSTFLTYTLGIAIASWGSEKKVGHPFLAPLRYPVFYAFILAMIFNSLHIKFPLPVDRVINLFSDANIPIMLILLGLQLGNLKDIKPNFALISTNVMRLIVSPAVGVALALVFAFQGTSYQVAVMQASMPTAVTSIILAVEFDLEPKFITYSVALSTVLSILTLTPIISWLT